MFSELMYRAYIVEGIEGFMGPSAGLATVHGPII